MEMIPTMGILTLTLLAFSVAGLGKIIIEYAKSNKILWHMAFTTGGMPSSHSATVSALTTSIFLHEGITSVFFISLFFSLVVMTDAIGVRLQTGMQGEALNKMMKRRKERYHFNERVGHTPTQVIAGATLGILMALSGALLLF